MKKTKKQKTKNKKKMVVACEIDKWLITARYIE